MMESDNQEFTKEELFLIRALSDFDLKMLLSEIHDHGWPIARKLLPMIKESMKNDPNYKLRS